MINSNIFQSNRPNILVVGDLMLDHYLWGTCDRISPEAPVQIVDIQKESTLLGGAGNVVHNLKSLGAHVGIISVVGCDDTSCELKDMLKSLNVDMFLVEEKSRKTSKKSRIIASHSQVIRYDNESKNDISKESQRQLLELFKRELDKYEVVLFSDYGKGVLTVDVTKALLSYAKMKNKKVLVDPKGEDYSKYSGAFLLTPNKKEAQLATGIKIKDESSLQKALEELKMVANLDISLITLSEEGIAILHENIVTKKPTAAREVYDVTGAGDTVLASLGYSLALKFDIYSSLEFANLAAGVVVGKIGSATASLDEIEEYKASLHKSSIQMGIKSQDKIEKLVKKVKQNGKSIVFTNGCFDILHRGHVSYLDSAKSFADILIVGLNSDHSVKRIKGSTRPINNQEDRAYMLSALECVDWVVVFEEDTPYELIKKIQPDILVKGADYKNQEVIGSDIAKKTQLIDFVEGRSTSKIIEKIKQN